MILTAIVVGFASGTDGHRPSISAQAMVLPILLFVFLVIDLDRPRRGLIEVSYKSLVELLNNVHAVLVSKEQF